MYANGDGVEVDRIKASEFYAVAAKGGVAEDRSSLASTMPTMGTSRLISSNPIDG
jgi:TPR repeat protein